MMILSEQEKNIIDFLREARPFESILVVKDKLGRPNSYLITRTQKIIVSNTQIEAIPL